MAAAAPRRSRRDWAWQLGIGAIQWPWLLRGLWGGGAAARARLLARLDLPAHALPRLGGWRADAQFLTLLAEHVLRHHPRTIVELGAGATTLVLARALQLAGGGRLVSVDHDAAFLAETRERLAAHDLAAELRHAPLADVSGDHRARWYDAVVVPDEIDLLVIDGPPWAVHPLIRGGAERLFARLPVGATLLLDDANRPGERIVARGWRKRWPGIRFRRRPAGKGTLVGRREA